MEGQTLKEVVDKIPFADLTISCQGQTFQAHRAFLCRESEAFKRALVGNFLVSIEAVLTSNTELTKAGGEEPEAYARGG